MLTEQRVFDITSANDALMRDFDAQIKKTDDAYLAQLTAIVKDIIAHRKEKPIILLSGPSGSGKTTTAYLIEQLLEERGFVTHTLSMDNYFLPLTEAEHELVAQGKIDLESPNRLNRELLNRQLSDMVACKPVPLPRYDFVHGLSVGSGITLTRKPDELVILEGIHALNPDVITIPDENTAKIYISVRSRVKCGDLILHPSKVRLLRRMIRDEIYRSRPFEKTIKFYHSVELGEERYIMPYKYRSTYDIETFIDYELNVLKAVLPKDISFSFEAREVISDLLYVLAHTDAADPSLIPESSLIREFIGGSKFSY